MSVVSAAPKSLNLMSPGIKEQMDSLGNSGEFTIREKASQSNFNTAIKETEITITVNWSGGG